MHTNRPTPFPTRKFYLSFQHHGPQLIYPDQKLYCLGMFHSSNKHCKGKMNEYMFGFHIICDKSIVMRKKINILL